MNRFFSQFTVITFMPAMMLLAGAVLGGWWPVMAVIYLTVVNEVASRVIGDLAESPVEPLLKTILPIGLAVAHFAVLGCAIWSLALKTGTVSEKALIFIGTGLFLATISNANGHELIHRRTRLEFRLGKWTFISLLFGHHTSAHLLVHHPMVATRFDPNSARLNESFRHFWLRAWTRSFIKGLRRENLRRGLPENQLLIGIKHPYFTYLGGAFGLLFLVGYLTGLSGVLWHLGLAAMAQTGLLLTDYMQHYGLSRQQLDTGKFEPVKLHHSWNAPHWFTRHLTLNAVRHSDHHSHAARPYTKLVSYSPDVAPQLPYPAGTMSVIAFFPQIWRRIMNPRVNQVLAAHQSSPPGSAAGKFAPQ